MHNTACNALFVVLLFNAACSNDATDRAPTPSDGADSSQSPTHEEADTAGAAPDLTSDDSSSTIGYPDDPHENPIKITAYVAQDVRSSLGMPLGGGESFQITLEIENWTPEVLVFDAIEMHFQKPPNPFFAGGIRITKRDEGIATTILYGKELHSAGPEHETKSRSITVASQKGSRLTRIPSGPMFGASAGSSPACINLLSKGTKVGVTQCGTLPNLATLPLASDLQPDELGQPVDFSPGDESILH